MNRTFPLLILLLLLLPFGCLLAQPLVREKTRFRFAQTYFGLRAQYLPHGQTTVLNAEGQPEALSLPGSVTPRFVIGGTHFWGLLDFFVSVPLAPGLGTAMAKSWEQHATTGLATGGRLYPLKVHFNRPNFYAGANWTIAKYRQAGEQKGPEVHRHRLGLEAGFNYLTSKGHLLELGIDYLPRPAFGYATSRGTSGRVRFAPVAVQLSYKHLFDFTRGIDAEGAGRFGAYLQQRGRQNAWYVSAGPSAAFHVGSSGYNRQLRPWLQNRPVTGVFPEVAAGLHLHRANLSLQLAYRHLQNKQEGYGLRQRAQRHSLSLEALKFVSDFHGFVPFIGAGLQREAVALKEQDAGATVTDAHRHMVAPALVFGWDIRPTRYEPFLLRTTLRYTPDLRLQAGSAAYSFEQLEFNFIQLVLFPQRWRCFNPDFTPDPS